MTAKDGFVLGLCQTLLLSPSCEPLIHQHVRPLLMVLFWSVLDQVAGWIWDSKKNL